MRRYEAQQANDDPSGVIWEIVDTDQRDAANSGVIVDRIDESTAKTVAEWLSAGTENMERMLCRRRQQEVTR